MFRLNRDFRDLRRREIAKVAMKERVGMTIPALYGGCAGLMFGSILWLGRRIAPFPLVFLYVLLFSLFLNFSMGFWFARRIWPVIHRELRQRGIELCTECNYTFQGLNSATVQCPECGAHRD